MDTKKKPNNRQILAVIGFSIIALISSMFVGAPNAAAASSAAATFVGFDTGSQGNWQTKYGADGHSIASSSQSLPSYASFTLRNESSEIWAANTTDVRGLQTPAGRIGSAWYAAFAFSMDINLTDGNSHQVALYGVDWSSRNRSESIQIVNATSGAILDSRTLSSFVNGTYLVWNIRGHVKVNVRLTGGLNVVTSGVFFGGAASSSVIAPAITTQPAGQTVVAGQSATFSIADTGTAPLLYQWSKNGTPIGGANSSSYTTPATTSSDNGANFAVAVSNTAGIATSNTAVLKVNAPTLILSASATSVNFGSVNVSSTSTQTVTLTNAGTGNVTISSVSVSGAGFNASGIPSGTILAPGQSAALTAAFAPASSGSATGSISIASNATSATTIALSGAGSATAHSVALSWSPSSSSVVGYNVYVSTVSGSLYTKLTAAPVNTLNYTDGGLQTAQNRYYVVTAVDSDNTESVFSNQVTAIIP